jgi:primary-amine oxidase
VECWLYDNVIYPTTEDLRTAWVSPDFQRLPGNVDGVWTHIEPDGFVDSNTCPENAPRTFTQLGKSRVQIDQDASFISWIGIEFNFAFSQVNGISLYDIRLDGERNVY